MSSPGNFSNDFFTREPGRTLILSGAAAAARGAYEAGCGLVLTYPGSPVVESFDSLADPAGPLAGRCHITINEHVAFHQALGYSLSGGRSLVIMKHVGFNVAADPAHYSAYTGVRGGMVVLVGSDPGAACSTGEFDVRFYSLHTNIPVLEPGSFQEASDLVREAFAMSEEAGLPVMVVIPSGFCYGVGTVRTRAADSPRTDIGFVNSPDYTCVGARAVERHRILCEKVRAIESGSLWAGFDAAKRGCSGSGEYLIVAPGIHRDIVLESLEELGVSERAAVYSPALTYPLRSWPLLEAIKGTRPKAIVFVEDLGGFVETQAARILLNAGTGIPVFGKSVFRPYGELPAAAVKNALGALLLDGERDAEKISRAAYAAKKLPDGPRAVPREGTFCPGCPHRSFFYSLKKYIRDADIIGGDIGCSSLPPHFSSWLTCMNSGISIASGTALAAAEGRTGQRVVSLIGDSTLFHSGLQTVMDCAEKDSDQICFVLDNGWTAMTGHQPTLSTEFLPDGSRAARTVSIRNMLEAAGVRRIHEVDPYRIKAFGLLMNKLIAQEERGFTAVIVSRECRLAETRRKKGKTRDGAFIISPERCVKCNECYSVLTCPAICKNSEGDLSIDGTLCAGCSACRQACPNGAIVNLKD